MKIGLPDEAIAAMYLIKTHYVVRVIKFYPEDQTVDVIQDTFDFTNTPLGDITIKNEFGQEVTVGLLEPSILYGIPVKQLRWGQFSIQACPKEGDTGYIEVFVNDISDWLENGGISVPKSDRHFTKENCVFVPFVANKTNSTPDYVDNENTLIIKSNNASITLTDSEEEGQEPVVDIETKSKTVHVSADDGITIDGDLDITGDISINGKVDVTGDISIKGDVDVTGGISATGEISSQVDVVVNTVAGSVSLLTHTHTSAAPGSPTSTPTVVPPTP